MCDNVVQAHTLLFETSEIHTGDVENEHFRRNPGVCDFVGMCEDAAFVHDVEHVREAVLFWHEVEPVRSGADASCQTLDRGPMGNEEECDLHAIGRAVPFPDGIRTMNDDAELNRNIGRTRLRERR